MKITYNTTTKNVLFVTPDNMINISGQSTNVLTGTLNIDEIEENKALCVDLLASTGYDANGNPKYYVNSGVLTERVPWIPVLPFTKNG